MRSHNHEKAPMWIVQALDDLRLIAKEWKFPEVQLKLGVLVGKAVAIIAPDRGFEAETELPEELYAVAEKFGKNDQFANAITRYRQWDDLMDSLRQMQELSRIHGEAEISTEIARVVYSLNVPRSLGQVSNINGRPYKHHVRIVHSKPSNE